MGSTLGLKLFLVAMVILGLVNSQQVFVKLIGLHHDDILSQSHGGCLLPDGLDMELSSESTSDLLKALPGTVHLVHNDARHSVGHVNFIRIDPSGQFYLEAVPLEQNEEVKRYYNHMHGITLTIRCSGDDLTGIRFALEGTIFLQGVKYLLKPSASLLVDGAEGQVTSLHVLERSDEHNAEDAAGKQDLPTAGGLNAPLTFIDHEVTNRIKRETTTVYHIDVLPVVDYSLYRSYPSATAKVDITNYISNLLTSVNMRMETLNLGISKLKVHLIEPVISQSEATSPWNANILESASGKSVLNATKLLSAFRDWLKNTTTLKYDHAFLLTANDIYGGNDQGIKYNITKGLAYVSSICKDNGESSSVIEEKGGYQSEGVLAHELGHSLGSTHDGDKNLCSSADRYLMSDSNYPPNKANAYNPWKFSNCSSASILKNIQELEKTSLGLCLTEKKGNDVNTSITILPNQQCRNIYGNTSFACRGPGFGNVSTFCEDFYCRIPARDTCERITAATGTCCGNQKKCEQGLCVQAAGDQCKMNDTCPLGDQPGADVLNGFTCANASLGYCYNSNFSVKCCDSCNARKLDIPGCEFGDKKLGCNVSLCANMSFNVDYTFSCCQTCDKKWAAETTVIYNGQQITCAQYIDKATASVCNDRKIHGEICPITCEARRDKINLECPWGDRKNCTSFYEDALKSPNFKCDTTQRESCCRTCDFFPVTTIAVPPTTLQPLPTTTTTTLKTTTTITTTQKPTMKAPTKACQSLACSACSIFTLLSSFSLLIVCLYITALVH